MPKQKFKPIQAIKQQKAGQIEARKQELERTGIEESQAESQAAAEANSQAEFEAHESATNPQDSVAISTDVLQPNEESGSTDFACQMERNRFKISDTKPGSSFKDNLNAE